MKAILDILCLLFRLALGGVLLYAAWHKLTNPQAFAEVVKAYKMVPDHLTIVSTFAVPWTEVIVGVCLIFGFWSRAAGAVATVLVAAFLATIIQAMVRGVNLTECGCFGKPLICSGPPSACHIIQDAVLLIMALFPMVFGGGYLSVDRVMNGRTARAAAAA